MENVYLLLNVSYFFSSSAPRNLLTAIQRLRGIRKEIPLVATAALEKREHHLTFLSGELAVFSLFDLQLSIQERQEMATQLFTLLEQWEPGEMLIDAMRVPHPNFCISDTFWPVSSSGLQLERPSLASFITTRSFLLWEVTSTHDTAYTTYAPNFTSTFTMPDSSTH